MCISKATCETTTQRSHKFKLCFNYGLPHTDWGSIKFKTYIYLQGQTVEFNKHNENYSTASIYKNMKTSDWVNIAEIILTCEPTN